MNEDHFDVTAQGQDEETVTTQITVEEAQLALHGWCDAAASGEKPNVLSCYAEDARLKGTVWDHIVDSPEKRNEYFTHFLAGKNNIRVLLEPEQEIESNGNAVRLRGQYTFCFDDDNGDAQEVAAEYKFSFSKDESGAVKIIGHFSSALDNFQRERTMLEEMVETTNRRYGLGGALSDQTAELDGDTDRNPA